MSTIFDVPGTNPPNPFVSDIDTFLASTSDDIANEAVSRLVCAVTDSKKPSSALWKLWDAFFNSVATLPSLHNRHRVFLEAIQSQPATTRTIVGAGSDGSREKISGIKRDEKLNWQRLPNFHEQWRDVHDVLEAWRHWDGIRDSDSGDLGSLQNSPSDRHFHFCMFSSVILKAGIIKDATLFIWVFYACRDTLEQQGPRPRQHGSHQISCKQLWDLDVKVTGIWVKNGATSLWEVDDDVLRPEWADTLDEPTALFPRTDGLTLERWQLWRDRLQALSSDAENLSEETRHVTKEASRVIKKLLDEYPEKRVY